MVTAGVYLLMRSSPLIEYSSTVLMLCLWIGAITTVFSSLIGLFQQDIKKVIAYSTMSQLGMMVIAIGLSSYNIALFHLVNHAFYIGLLFLGAGSVIHAVLDNLGFSKCLPKPNPGLSSPNINAFNTPLLYLSMLVFFSGIVPTLSFISIKMGSIYSIYFIASILLILSYIVAIHTGIIANPCSIQAFLITIFFLYT